MLITRNASPDAIALVDQLRSGPRGFHLRSSSLSGVDWGLVVFLVPPPKAEEMSMPETFGRGASDRVVIE